MQPDVRAHAQSHSLAHRFQWENSRWNIHTIYYFYSFDGCCCCCCCCGSFFLALALAWNFSNCVEKSQNAPRWWSVLMPYTQEMEIKYQNQWKSAIGMRAMLSFSLKRLLISSFYRMFFTYTITHECIKYSLQQRPRQQKDIISFRNYTVSFALLYRSGISLILFVLCHSVFFDRRRFHSDCGDDKTPIQGRYAMGVCVDVKEMCALSQQAFVFSQDLLTKRIFFSFSMDATFTHSLAYVSFEQTLFFNLFLYLSPISSWSLCVAWVLFFFAYFFRCLFLNFPPAVNVVVLKICRMCFWLSSTLVIATTPKRRTHTPSQLCRLLMGLQCCCCCFFHMFICLFSIYAAISISFIIHAYTAFFCRVSFSLFSD